jgi:peptide/nickel transport system substrate-binding protein
MVDKRTFLITRSPDHPITRFALALCCIAFVLGGCTRSRPDPNTLVMIIESSPSNLDPRVGTDAQSERIDKLIFDSLVRRDEHFQLRPSLAERWEIPDPLTYVFHLRKDVRFHDGTPLTSRDVKWTFDSVLDGTVITAKKSTFNFVERIEAPDAYTVVFHLKEPNATLLWNVSDGSMDIIPYGSGKDFNTKLVGSGPFKFVSAVADSQVVIVRNDEYWGEKAKIPRIRFAVIPDATTRALELRKGSADAAINALNPDMVLAMQKDHGLETQITPGTIYAYLAFNLRDPILKDERVREALDHAIDRKEIIHYLWRDMAEPASSVLPRQHWAYDPTSQPTPHDPAKARQILDAAGYKPVNGVRFHLTMKTSTEESTRILATVLQQQLREIGVALDIRSFEFATFYSDVTKGAFQLYGLRWIGGNEDPDIYEHAFHSASFPPKRANRSYYSNPKVDELIERGRRELDQSKRREIYIQLQRILNEERPYLHLFYLDNVLVHTKRVRNIHVNPSGSYDFLRTAELAQ